LAAVVVCASAPGALAADAAPDEARANLVRAQAEEMAARGDCKGAVEKFQVAYALGRRPDDLFSLAQCWLKLGAKASAKEALFHFLEVDPKGPRAGEAFALIAAIDSGADPTPAAPAPPMRLSRVLALAAGGVAVGLAGVGAAYGLQSRSTGNTIANVPHSRDEVATLKAQLSSQATKANVLFAAGGAAAIGAGVLWVVKF
jgi:hypothetical protein